MGCVFYRDLRAGIAAGFAAALLLHGTATWDALRAGAGGWTAIGTLAEDLASGAARGAAFAAIFRYQPESPAFSASGGLLFGLLGWIAGPLTAAPHARSCVDCLNVLHVPSSVTSGYVGSDKPCSAALYTRRRSLRSAVDGAH